MTRRTWAYAAAFGVVVTTTTALGFLGCGGDDAVDPGPTTEAGADNTTVDQVNPPIDGQSDVNVDSATCKATGNGCTSSSECCSANCDPVAKACARPFGQCKQPNDSCTVANECCTLTCVGGKCGATLCTSDNQPCTQGSACCGGQCNAANDGGAKTCTPLNNQCKTAGNKCAAHGECCSKVCQNGVCSNQVSFCTQVGDVCSTDLECCGGICNKQQGQTLGVCRLPQPGGGVPGCTINGQVCGAGASPGDAGFTDGGIPACGGECCSRACAPFGPSRVLVCQPASGCRPAGEPCRVHSDCCHVGSDPGKEPKCEIEQGQTVGRCDNGQSCRAAGSVCKLATSSCNAENNCCAGNVNVNPLVCQQDTLGIPRCTIGAQQCTDAGVSADGGALQGKPCASSADCCGLNCTPTNDGGLTCNGACVPTQGRCTTSADCCNGIPCYIPPGFSTGFCGQAPSDAGTNPDGAPPPDAGPPPVDAGTDGCALYGQTCSSNGDCCDGVPCISGRCRFPF